MGLKVIVESHIPYIKGVVEQVGEVEYLAPEEMTREAVADADAIITRTRTRCDRELLEGSRCRLVVSATIGLDHVDKQWCESAGITVANAPGCNAQAVAQYVCASLLSVWGGSVAGRTLGVVGVGNVGKIVARWAKSLGMNVLLCDPPRAEREGGNDFCSLEKIADEADAVTFHTPLTRCGEHATYHLCGRDFLSRVKKLPVIINSARGGVVDTAALVEAMRSGAVSQAVIDCWEGEPNINRELLELSTIATPHIAGYSAEGKIRATHMAVNALTEFFGLPKCEFGEPTPADAPDGVSAEMIMSTYDPMEDTRALRSAPEDFEALRNHYHLRQEPR